MKTIELTVSNTFGDFTAMLTESEYESIKANMNNIKFLLFTETNGRTILLPKDVLKNSIFSFVSAKAV